MRRFARSLVALCVLGVPGVFGMFGMACSCGSSEGTYTFDYPGAPCDRGYAECSSDADCWEGFVYEPETRCIDDVCQCPVDGYIICNKLGHPVENNMRGCYHPSECEPGEVCQPEAPEGEEEEPPPPPPEPECTPETVSMCPGPPDKRCGAPTCFEGVCGVALTPGPIASQKAGDCKQSICDFTGKVVEEEDASDYYDDGAECTFDYCDDAAIASASMNTIVCPETGEGYCAESACIQCLDHSHCTGSELCILDHCRPDTCMNGILDVATESDFDCGGVCEPCVSARACITGNDCRSRVCKDSLCEKPTCDDAVQNDGETDTDCGAACKDPAKLCGDGQGCQSADDCASGVCWAGTCQAPTCTDGVQNDKETGIDCGGACEGC